MDDSATPDPKPVPNSPSEESRSVLTIHHIPHHYSVTRFARLMLDVTDGDRARALGYARKFEQSCDDKIFARAVRLQIEKHVTEQK